MNLTEHQEGYWRIVWRRFKRHSVAYVGFFFFVFLLLLVILGPHLVPYQLDQVSLGKRMHMPSAATGLAPMNWDGTRGSGSCMGDVFHSRSG